VKFEFVRDYCSEYPFRLIRKVLGVSRSGYYDWLHRSALLGEQKYAIIDQRIIRAFEKGRGNYGVERIRKTLANEGVSHGDKLIRKRMHALDLHVESKRKFVKTTDSGHNEPCAENLLNRDFRAPAPNMVYVGDITYVPGSNGWLFVATVIDLYSRALVGWEVAERMDVGLVNRAFLKACRDRNPEPGFIFHSDRGSQYASREFRSLLASWGAVQSMSRKGDCWDNAVAESVNSIIKREWMRRRIGPPGTLKTVERELFDYIECFYNRTRIHSYLNFVSPAEFEADYFAKNAAA